MIRNRATSISLFHEVRSKLRYLCFLENITSRINKYSKSQVHLFRVCQTWRHVEIFIVKFLFYPLGHVPGQDRTEKKITESLQISLLMQLPH
ncbi:hypothetical protein G9A89_009223 [Geosiphon pyriformis]|nr:hypothetical protein G9A89_009223 [Geosiphon pyriformis]